MRKKVVIVGGGIAGLTAAHELVERGFEVLVYERRSEFGGKAASRYERVPAAHTPVEDARSEVIPFGSKELGVPVEHGFRFFPNWYRHLIDTMKRIPYKGRRREYEGATVFGNLVPVEKNVMAWSSRTPLTVPMRIPTTFSQIGATAAFIRDFGRMGISAGEALDFAAKIAHVLAADDIEHQRLQLISWWDFTDAASKSQAFQEFTRATTSSMVAAKADQVNADTIGKIAVRTLLDLASSVDHVLDGPTHEKFIHPWQEHLQGRGVTFHTGFELDSLRFKQDQPKLEAVVLKTVLSDQAGSLSRLLASIRYDVASLLDAHREQGRLLAQRLEQDTPHDAQASSAQAIAANAPTLLTGAVWVEPTSLRSKRELLRKRIDTNCKTALDLLSEVNRLWPQNNAALSVHQVTLNPLEPVLRLEAAISKHSALDDAVALSTQSRTVGWKDQDVLEPLGSLKARLQDTPALLQVCTRLQTELTGLRQAFDDIEAHASLEQLRKAKPRRAVLNSAASLFAQIEAEHAFEVVTSDFFILALPVEQMAYYVNRSATLRSRAPELAGIIALADYTSWMAGIQFYLTEQFDFIRGHIVGADSPWALTMIEQTQFWNDTAIHPKVKCVISVDIGDWSKRGQFVKKAAWDCQHQEIATEIWEQLKLLTSPEDRQPRLRDDMLFTQAGESGLTRRVNYNIDDSITDLFDRKKQGAYERARSVALSREDITPAAQNLPATYMWGRRALYNVEPILVNRVGSQALRPDVKTSVQNLFLAADYIRTQTDLACMEGANEAGRRAVNALLDAVGSRKPRCELWHFNQFSHAAEKLTQQLGIETSGRAMAGAARSATDSALSLFGTAARAFGSFVSGVERKQ